MTMELKFACHGIIALMTMTICANNLKWVVSAVMIMKFTVHMTNGLFVMKVCVLK